MRRRQGRPGLVATMARTAAITGTASAVSGSVAQRQHAKAQVAPSAPESHPTTETTPIAELERLAALKQKGLLTDDEFVTLKTWLLAP